MKPRAVLTHRHDKTNKLDEYLRFLKPVASGKMWIIALGEFILVTGRSYRISTNLKPPIVSIFNPHLSFFYLADITRPTQANLCLT